MNKKLIVKLREIGVTIAPSSKINPKIILDCEPPVSVSGEISWRGSIGAYSYVRGGRLSGGLKSIGRYCSIAPGVTVGDSNHPTHWLSTHPFQHGEGKLFKNWTKKPKFSFLKLPTNNRHASHIGNDVWIGANAMIMPGVMLGDGSIVGAGSIVTRDVPPYAIVAGSPAKIIRYRFDTHIIEQLLELKWWRFEADSLLGVAFDDIELAITQIRQLELSGSLQLISEKKVRVLGRDLTQSISDKPANTAGISTKPKRPGSFVRKLLQNLMPNIK